MNYLIRFSNKRQVRLLVCHNHKISISHSSIYKIENISYILLNSKSALDIPLWLGIEVVENKTIIENYLFEWANSEVLQTTSYIQFEQNSVLTNKCRMMEYQNKKIYRCFEPLADIFAILNYTIDSFSDGGKYNSIDCALNRIREHCQNGAHIIDLGVESSRPGGQTIIYDANDEIRLLKQILPHVLELKHELKFGLSIDTFRPDTISWLLDFDIDIINDVSGNLPLGLVNQILNTNKRYLAMHSITLPVDTDKMLDNSINPLDYIYDWQHKKIESIVNSGGNIANLILDPGIGFAFNSAQSWFIVRHLAKLSALPCEYMLGYSRKSFFNHITTKAYNLRDLETIAVTSRVLPQVDYIRIHDLELFNQVYPVFNQLG